MIDVHCHPLPGLDDGPATVEDAVALASAHVDAGVTKVIATPHLSWEYDVTAERIRSGVNALRGELDRHGITLGVEVGAEVAITVAIESSAEELSAVTLGGGGWLLLEAPLALHAPSFQEMIQQVQSRGFRIMLAHPERCPEIHRRPGILRDLVGIGVRTQITATSLTGAFGSRVRELCFDMISDCLVHNVASDAHDVEHRRPGLREEIACAGLSDAITWWTEEVPGAILAGEMTPAMPESLESLFASDWRPTTPRQGERRRPWLRRSRKPA